MQDPSKGAPHTDFQVLLFISSLCVICALSLAVVAYILSTPQKEAKEFDQRKQMLIAAKILSHSGYFELLDDEGKTQIAQLDPDQMILVADPEAKKATEDQIKQVAESRIRPLLTDKEGSIYSLEEKEITLTDYLEKNKKTGYANLPLKLFYAILPNKSDAQNITASELAKDSSQIYAYVIPVSGFGLWAPIYGYLAIGKNGDEVIGTTWYDHGETPGLGANITEAKWQDQFYKKLIFQESSSGTTDFQTTDMGLIVVKGKVLDVFGSSPKSKSAVDGISGATLTGDGVTQAYRNSLQPYREFFIKVNKGFDG